MEAASSVYGYRLVLRFLRWTLMRLWILRMELQVLAWWWGICRDQFFYAVWKRIRFAFAEVQANLFGLSLGYDFGCLQHSKEWSSIGYIRDYWNGWFTVGWIWACCGHSRYSFLLDGLHLGIWLKSSWKRFLPMAAQCQPLLKRSTNLAFHSIKTFNFLLNYVIIDY